MSFLGLERPIEYSGVQVFDPTMAKMVLDAQDKYFNVLYADYQQGLQDMKEFKKEYGDFITPILADQEWYNNNVIGKVRNFINDAYARGIDLTRSAEGRAAISQLINSIDVGSVNKLRSSADNAREFLKERSRLEVQGLYNPLLAKYEGFDPNTYNTLDQLDAEGNVIAGRGIWDKMSPTPYHNMADFSKSYFDNIQPFQRSATKNGISYTISSITPEDLHRIADAHFNDLVQTPQGRLMYQYYKDQLGSDEAARNAFNDAVVSGNTDRLRYSDNYDEQAYRMENLAIKRQNLALRRQIAAAKQRGDNGGPNTQLSGISLAQSWYDTAMANAYSIDGYTKDWDKMHLMYGDFSRDASKLFHDFGKKYAGGIATISDTDLDAAVKQSGTAAEKDIVNRWKTPGLNGRSKELNDQYNNIKRKYSSRINGIRAAENVNQAYRQQFTIPMDGKSVAEIIGTPLSDNKMVAKIGEGSIDKIFGRDDIVSNTAGYTKTHTTTDTKKIRDAIKKWGVNNTTVTSMERGYGSLRKNTGNFEVNPEIKIVCTDNDGNVQFVGYGYYDIGLGSNSTKGGAYLGNYKTTGGAIDLGNMTGGQPRLQIGDNMYNGPVEIGAQRIPGLVYTPEQSTREYNMFPDYNRWTAFGVWDTDLTSKRLHAGASEKLGTYGNPYDESLWDYDEDEE